MDVRYAFRQLIKHPGFTLAVIATLALGIGANTAIFTVIDGVLLRPAPFDDMDRLVMVWETDRNSGTTREPASVPDYIDFQDRAQSFEVLAAFNGGELIHTPADGEPRRLAVGFVSHEFFPMLGVRPLVGQGLTEANDRPGAPLVVLISEQLWERQFARDPDVPGQTILLNDVPTTIAGVMSRSAEFGTLQILDAAAYGRSFADRGERVTELDE